MDKVRVSSAESRTGRLVAARILPGTDLIAGLLKICSEHDVKTGCVVSMLGSLSMARFIYAVPDASNKMGMKFVEPLEVEGPLEFLSGSGIIGAFENGEPAIHLHAVFADKEDRCQGGHLVEGGNTVLGTVEVVIQEITDVEFIRALDEETGFTLFKICGKGGSEK